MAKSNEDKYQTYLDILHNHDIDIGRRIMYFGTTKDNSDEDGLVDWLYLKFIKNFQFLERLSSDPIVINMTCDGGDTEKAFGLYDLIVASKCHVTINCLSTVMSSGMIILQAADVRASYPSTRFMCHYGSVQDSSGNMTDIIRYSDSVKKDMATQVKILSERSGRKASYWRQAIAIDKYMTPEEAIQLGLLDKIITDS